jgi:hypothetical protein
MGENKLIMMMVIIFDLTLISRLRIINNNLFDIDLFYHEAFRIPFMLKYGLNYSAEVFVCSVYFIPKLERVYDWALVAYSESLIFPKL